MDFVASNTVRSSAGAKSSLSITSAASSSTSNDLFKTVGGNNEAKLALEDALALNPKKRRLLSLFGMNAPTGVLLYGPPGTGKTLLARAIAKAISVQNKPPTKNIGGTFISLKASDIVRPEVGNSEKLVVSAFESARVNAPAVVFIDEFQVSNA
jgi:ATP-dependent 26S proteasome regulatory subunit